MRSWVILKVEAFLLLNSWFNLAFASNCHRIDDQFTFHTDHDLSQHHIYKGETIIHVDTKVVLLLLSQNGQHIALDPYSMSTNIGRMMPFGLNDEKKQLNGDDVCAKSRAITEFGMKNLHATSDDKLINFCLYESNLPNAPLTLTRIDYTNPTILLAYNNANDTKSYSLAVRPMCKSIFPDPYKPFRSITAMTYVKSSSHGKPNRAILHIAFVDEHDRKHGLIYYGICTFDVDDLISKMNDPKAQIIIRNNTRWENSTIDVMQKSSSINFPLIGILNETFPSLSPNSKARLNYEFNNHEEIKMHVVLADVNDGEGQFYDKHFIYTSMGNIYMGITSQNLNSSFLYMCNVGMDIQEISIWNRKRLILKSKYKITSLPLSNCQSYNCSECYQFKDPSCVYNPAKKSCMNRMLVNKTMKSSIKTILRDIDSSKICALDRQNVEQGLSQTPRMIQNVTITAHATEAEIKWDIQEGPQLKIDLQLFRRLDKKVEVWRKSNVKSPILVDKLEPAMPYTLVINVIDGQAEPFILTEQFQTAEGAPDPPLLEDIRVINTETGLKCEVEWRPPSKPNGRIIKYYVRLIGKIRYVSPESRTLTTNHYPEAIELCTNYDGNQENGIDPRMFPSNFYACKFGPLKPNRNYTATIWAENSAGKSEPILFKEQCVTDFAEPDLIEPPETIVGPNTTSFGLKFPAEPDEGNGPIACYYLAIVPIPSNVSLERLPQSEVIIMESVEKAHQNNLYLNASLNQRYFAYIAESYMHYPKETVIGDQLTSYGVESCNVLYLTRYKPVDSALNPDLTYTGFLIVSVDRDKAEHAPKHKNPKRHLLSMNDPTYGFSNYFKPAILQADIHQFHLNAKSIEDEGVSGGKKLIQNL